jgi:hypothetical protein
MAKTNNGPTGKPLGKPTNTPAPAPTRAVAETPKAGAGIIAPFGTRKPLLKPDVQGCNYVQFVNPKAKRFAEILSATKMKAKDWPEDQPVLNTVGGPVVLDPFEYLLTSQYFQHFSEFDDQYNILSSIMDVDEKPGGSYTEFVEALIVVHHKGNIYPATCGFKSTKTAAFHTFNTYLSEGRIEPGDDGVLIGAMATYTSSEYTSKSSRRELIIGDCTVDTTPKDVAALVKKAFGNAAFLADLQKCVTAMKARYALVESKLVS